jgi:hypothetical protein
MKTQVTEQSERNLLSEFTPAASLCEAKRRGLNSHKLSKFKGVLIQCQS